jgi:predicted nucleotidyltransferase component of viral defense system
MAAHDDQVLHYHEDADLFRSALTFTESATGFSARLIEKDYYCSLLLHDLSELFGMEMVFKGGTCLSKVYANLYRLSEDLDFVFSVKIDAPRSDRRKIVGPAKERIDGLSKRLPCFDEVESLRASNRSRQYGGRYSYRSIVTGQSEVIKVEISLREPLLDPIERRSANTMLLDPFRNVRVVEPISIRSCCKNIRPNFSEGYERY